MMIERGHHAPADGVFQEECATCGWANQASDAAWVKHSGIVHTTMLKPGHVLTSQINTDIEQAEKESA